MKKFLKNRKGDEESSVGLGIAALFAIVIGALFMGTILVAGGQQFGFLQALTGGARGEVLVVAQGAYKTDVSVVGNIELKKPPLKKIFSADERIYAMTAGSFRGRGDEIAVLLPNYKIKSLDGYTIVDDFGGPYTKHNCKINKMYAADVVGEGKEDLFIAANCEGGSIAFQLYRITEINDFGSNKADDSASSSGLVDESHVAFADFDGDGKQDLVFANYFKGSGQTIKVFYDFDKASGDFKESKEILRRSNMRITALVAGDFTGSKHPDILFFSDDKELWRIKDVDLNKQDIPAFTIADVSFDVDNNKEVIYANPEGQPVNYVKQAALVVGNFKGDKKQELLIAYGDGGERYGKGHMVLISALDKDAPESNEIEPEGLVGQGAVQIISLAVGRFSYPMFLNKKAQAGEISMGIAALGFIILVGIVAFFFFIILRGNIIRESATPFAQGEYALSTTSYLSNLMDTRDEYGVKYSDLIALAYEEPSPNHPSGKSYSDYLNEKKEGICSWLDSNLGERYYFFVLLENNVQLECGIRPDVPETYSEEQFLPVKSSEDLKATLVTWP